MHCHLLIKFPPKGYADINDEGEAESPCTIREDYGTKIRCPICFELAGVNFHLSSSDTLAMPRQGYKTAQKSSGEGLVIHEYFVYSRIICQRLSSLS